MYEEWEAAMLTEWCETLSKLGPTWLEGVGPHGPGELDLANPPGWFEVHDKDYGCDDSPPWARCHRLSQAERANFTGGHRSPPVDVPW
jgi:hypothetical protein|tara:strand:+ start:112 stop:375 length:264 start_codon:yes stop_codon:yes gene_type:complete